MVARWLRPIDRLFLAVYGSRLNPLYQSGTVAVLGLLVAMVSGLYLLFFYRVGAPYESVQGLQGQLWAGRWVRALHRYSSDLTMIAVLAHALKMLMSGRSWGRRTLAWLSGLALTGLVVFVGVTGLVMVWDTQAQILAVEAVQVLDRAPLLSEPLSRMFADNGSVPGSFFFMVMFLHVAAPLGGVALLWIHVARVARPLYLPPRPLSRLLVGCLVLASLLFPLTLNPPADLLSLPGRVPLDLLYAFWASPFLGIVPTVVLGALAAAIPWLTRPRVRPAPSSVDERLCTGCTTCVQDCPYDAIRMVPRSEPSRASELVARVNPDLCVSCGICAGSCAPMGVGPPGRTGRDQLRSIESLSPGRDEVVVVVCRSGAPLAPVAGIRVHTVGCAGSVHTSVLELLLRQGAAGVLVAACPDRDCSHREGPKWLEQRVFHGREAELQPRVDRRRIRLAGFSSAQAREAGEEAARFREEVLRLGALEPAEPVPLETECLRDA